MENLKHVLTLIFECCDKSVYGLLDKVILCDNSNGYNDEAVLLISTAWKLSKYRVISGQYFHVFSPSTGKYVPGITPY